MARLFMHLVLVVLWVAPLAKLGTAATFFVSPSGSDSGPGSADAPFKTVQRGVNALGPGDALFVLPGQYSEAVILDREGTPEFPLSIQFSAGAELVSPDPTASLSALDIRGIGYVNIQGLAASGGYHETIFVRPGSHDISLRECRISGNRAGLWIAGAERVLVEDCLFADQSAHGVRIFAGSRQITIRRTRAENNDDGLGCAGDADGFSTSSDTEDVAFEDSVAQGNGEDGFDLQGPATVRRSASIANGCAGFKFFRGGSGENLFAARNRLGLTATTLTASGEALSLNYCTFADNSEQQVFFRSPLGGDSSGFYLASLQNSLLIGDGKALEVEPRVRLSESYNLFFRPDTTAVLVVLHGTNGRQQFSGQDVNAGLYRAVTGMGQNTYALDPLFDMSAGDYRLSPASPAVDSADPASPVTNDRVRQTRPLGLRNDRGAIESSHQVANHAPWPDPGPDRVVTAGKWFKLSAYGSADVDSDPLSFLWSFEGSPNRSASGFQVSHLFSIPGVYRVTLTASDGQSSAARTVNIRADFPPSGRDAHDSSVVPFARPISVKLRPGVEAQRRILRIRVRNEDPPSDLEPLGHLVRLRVSDGSCPAGTVVSMPDFEPRLPGTQDVALVSAGRSRTARIELSLRHGAPPQCVLEAMAETLHRNSHDPNPANDRTMVEIRIRN